MKRLFSALTVFMVACLMAIAAPGTVNGTDTNGHSRTASWNGLENVERNPVMMPSCLLDMWLDGSTTSRYGYEGVLPIIPMDGSAGAIVLGNDAVCCEENHR